MAYRGLGTFDSAIPGTASSGQQPPRKRRGPLIAALASAAVVIVAATTTVILTNRDDEPGQSVAQRPAPPNSTSGTATTTASRSVVAPEAVVPGWQAVNVPERGGVYDVPPAWELDEPENVIGFGPPEDAVTMTGVAIHEKGFCADQAGSFRAFSGATAREGTDDADVAATTAGKLGELAYTVDGQKPHVALGPPEPLQLANGAMEATRVVATVTPAAPEPCGSPSVLVSAVATNSDGNSSVVHLTIADQGVPAAVPPDVVNRIGESFRPGN